MMTGKKNSIEECNKESRWYDEEGFLTEEEEDDDDDDDEDESPKSVMKEKKNKKKEKGKKGRIVHSQVLKIREEDSHVGEDVIMEILSGGKDYNYKVMMIRSMVLDNNNNYDDDDDDDNREIIMRPMLPCSPLSRKTTVN